jgi:hypothetical protein
VRLTNRSLGGAVVDAAVAVVGVATVVAAGEAAAAVVAAVVAAAGRGDVAASAKGTKMSGWRGGLLAAAQEHLRPGKDATEVVIGGADVAPPPLREQRPR